MKKSFESVVVVGASSGLGLRIARIYIERGCRVGIAARRLDPLRELQSIAPDRVVVAAIDVVSADTSSKLRKLIDEVGDVDLIVNVAGVGYANPMLDATEDDRTAATNCLGFTRVVDEAFRYFADTGRRGQIAAISSVAGTMGLGVAASYSASKSYQATYLNALDQLRHIRHLPIGITDIRPGFIRTDLLDSEQHYPMLMDPDRAAAKIVRAIDRRRRVKVIDWRWNIVVGLWRLLPKALWTHLPVKLKNK